MLPTIIFIFIFKIIIMMILRVFKLFSSKTFLLFLNLKHFATEFSVLFHFDYFKFVVLTSDLLSLGVMYLCEPCFVKEFGRSNRWG